MRKLIIILLLSLPMMAVAQDVITSEQQLEQAQKQLEEAKKALEEAKANAEKAKAEAEEAKRKAEEEAQNKQLEAEKAKIEEERAKLQEETERIKAETERLQAETEKIQTETGKIQEETGIIQEETVNIPAETTESQIETVKTQKETLKVQENTVTTPTTGWTAPAKETKKKVETEKPVTNQVGQVLKEDPKYLEGAVTLNEKGKVEFVLDTSAGGKSADEIYQITYDFLNTLTLDEHQIGETSRIVLVNPQEHAIACVMKEWLVFQNSFISLDRSEFQYHLTATITDDHLNLVLSRIIYNYEKGRSTGFESPAEEVITDEYALNKKKTNLARIFGKFRKGTINRKDEIFTSITDALK